VLVLEPRLVDELQAAVERPAQRQSASFRDAEDPCSTPIPDHTVRRTLTNQWGPPEPPAQHTMPRGMVIGCGGLGCRGTVTYDPAASRSPCTRKLGSGLQGGHRVQ
jgi:hypothetical protein